MSKVVAVSLYICLLRWGHLHTIHCHLYWIFLGSVRLITIKSIAAYPDLFPWHFLCSTHFYEQKMNVHWCVTIHIHKLLHIAFIHIYSFFQYVIWDAYITLKLLCDDTKQSMCASYMMKSVDGWCYCTWDILLPNFLEFPCMLNPREVGYNGMEVLIYLNSF